MLPTQAQIDQTIEQLDSMNKQVEAGLVALNQIKIEQEGVQAGIDRLKNILAETQTELTQVKGSLDSATSTRADVLSQLNDLETKLSAAKSDLDSTLTANSQAKITGVAQLAEVQLEQDKIVANAKAKVDVLTTKKTEIEKQIQPLADQIVRLNAQISSFNVQIVSLNSQIATATQTLSDLNVKINSAQQTVNDVQAKSDGLTSEITNKQAQSAQLDTDIATKQSLVSDLDKQIADSQAELAKNALTNADFLKARADVVAGKQTNQQREDLLRAKYGELGEPFN